MSVLLDGLALSVWLAGNMAVVLWVVITLACLPQTWAVCSLGLQVLLVLAPLDIKTPAAIERFLVYSVQAAKRFFPMTVVFEDRAAFKPGTAYLIAYEPHSVLPLGLCAFSQFALDMPQELRGYLMGTSAIFIAPIMRHLCWWAGLRSVSRKEIKATLAAGMSCSLCPGGVQECIYMQPGKEVVFLRKRTGFVRIALEHGAPIVPVFAFGQTPQYNYARPFIDFPKRVIPSSNHPVSRFARAIGYVPLICWGWGITAIPRRVPMYCVVGRPIPVPKLADPPPEAVERYLQEFISSVERLFQEYKAAAGCPDEQLVVY